MSMRISEAGIAIALLLTITACGRESDDPRVVAGAAAKESSRGRIACRLGDAGDYRPACTAERTAVAGGQLLTLRGPDGGFHRLLVAADGHTVTAADGAEPATIATTADGATEVAVGGDRYRLPGAGAGRESPATK